MAFCARLKLVGSSRTRRGWKLGPFCGDRDSGAAKIVDLFNRRLSTH